MKHSRTGSQVTSLFSPPILRITKCCLHHPHLPSVPECLSHAFTAMNQRRRPASHCFDSSSPVYLSNYNTQAQIAPVNLSEKFRNGKTRVNKGLPRENTKIVVIMIIISSPRVWNFPTRMKGNAVQGNDKHVGNVGKYLTEQVSKHHKDRNPDLDPWGTPSHISREDVLLWRKAVTCTNTIF